MAGSSSSCGCPAPAPTTQRRGSVVEEKLTEPLFRWEDHPAWARRQARKQAVAAWFDRQLAAIEARRAGADVLPDWDELDRQRKQCKLAYVQEMEREVAAIEARRRAADGVPDWDAMDRARKARRAVYHKGLQSPKGAVDRPTGPGTALGDHHHRGPDDEPPTPLSPPVGDLVEPGLRMQIPPLGQDPQAAGTLACFELYHGVSEWPDTDCTAPYRRLGRPCEPPSEAEVTAALHLFPNHGNKYARDPRKFLRVPDTGFGGYPGTTPRGTRVLPVDPSPDDLRLFGSAVAVLLANRDIAEWAACLVEAWSPETRGLPMAGMVEAALDGTWPLHVSFVDRSISNPSSTAWAFTQREGASAMDGTLGIILPIRHPTWEAAREERQRRYPLLHEDNPGAVGLCAATTYAGVILHEIIHIIGDHYTHEAAGYTSRYGALLRTSNYGADTHAELDLEGTLHEDMAQPCWDEARMVATIFYNGMGQRYPCLQHAERCREYFEAWRFGHSARGV